MTDGVSRATGYSSSTAHVNSLLICSSPWDERTMMINFSRSNPSMPSSTISTVVIFSPLDSNIHGGTSVVAISSCRPLTCLYTSVSLFCLATAPEDCKITVSPSDTFRIECKDYEVLVIVSDSQQKTDRFPPSSSTHHNRTSTDFCSHCLDPSAG